MGTAGGALGPVLAHPLTTSSGLGLPPLAIGLIAAGVVAAVCFAVPARDPDEDATPSAGPVDSWDGGLSARLLAGRALGVLLLLAAIVAGRVGADHQLENLAPALVVGAGWPLLLIGSALIGPVWRVFDPWDALARPVAAPGEAAGDVRPAVLLAVAWTWYLSVYPAALSPRAVGSGLAVYSILMLAGCLALGRLRWLSSAEPFGILLGWIGRLPRGRLPAWEPPRGASLLLGALLGGLLFGAIRRSDLWGSLNTVRGSEMTASLWLIGFAVLGAASIAAASSLSRRAAPGSVEASAVPAVAGIAVALAMASNRLFTSVQLLPALLGDPLGRGWDLLGKPGVGLDPSPLGSRGLMLAQVVVLLGSHVAGGVVLARRVSRGRRFPGALVMFLSVAAAASIFTVPFDAR